MARVGSAGNPLTVAVVGSGPSGFYAAEALLNAGIDVRIHLIEKLPVPFGLVRYGVAPDHPKLKQVSLVFDRIAQDARVRYFGNVNVGCDVTLDELKSTHQAVVLCCGAELDRDLNLPGEDLPGSHTATEFVAWYNGHPHFRDRSFDFSSEVAVIIGQGNVAADVCRILAKPVDELRSTDIAKHALEQLACSRIREIHVVGRRGPTQTKFSSKELRELGRLSNCSARVSEEELILAAIDQAELSLDPDGNAAQCYQLFQQFAHEAPAAGKRVIQFHFLKSPCLILGESRVKVVAFVQNELTGEPFNRVAQATKATMELSCGLCFRSIGYRGRRLDGAPFDDRLGLIPNERGRVLDDRKNPIVGLYASGWIKRGPSGVIGTNRSDSVETITTLIGDLEAICRVRSSSNDAFPALLEKKRVRAVSYREWQRIDALEDRLGREQGKPREKLSSVSEMLAAAGQQESRPRLETGY